MLRPVLTIVVLLSLAVCGCGETTVSKSTATTDPAIVGDWQVVGIQAAGNEVPADKLKQLNLTYSFTDKQVTIRRPDKPEKSSSYTVDITATPKRIVLDTTPPGNGLYAIEGDTLQLCLMVDDAHQGKHPSVLASSASPATDLITLKRVGATTPPAPTPAPTTPTPTTPAPATPAASDPALAGRTIWQFKDAPKVFPDQTEFSGKFRQKEGKQWYSEKADGSFYHDYELSAVTPEYVEIMRPGGGFFLRLYNDRADYRYGSQPDFQKMCDGEWAR